MRLTSTTLAALLALVTSGTLHGGARQDTPAAQEQAPTPAGTQTDQPSTADKRASQPTAQPAARRAAPPGPVGQERIGSVPMRLTGSARMHLTVPEDSPFRVVWSENRTAGDSWMEVSLVGPESGSGLGETSERLKAILKDILAKDDPFGTAMAKLVNVDFKGGTPGDFLAAVLPPETPVNILYSSPTARTAMLPPLVVQQVSRYSALNLMQDLLRDPSVGEAQGLQWEFGNWNTREGPREHPTLTVMSRGPSGRNPMPGIEPEVLRIMPADSTIQKVREELALQQQRIIDTISAGINFQGGPSSTFKLKLSPETGVLFVQGTPAERALVKNVVRAIMQAAPTPAPAATPAAAPNAPHAAGTAGRAPPPTPSPAESATAP